MRIILSVLIMVMFAVPAVAVTYEWEDSQGTVNFSEDLGSVPKQYRKNVKILGAEEEMPADTEETPADQAAPGTGEVSKEQAPGKPVEPAVVQEKRYGGKSEAAWRTEFAELNWKIKSEEEQLDYFKERLKDSSKMSRGEYLSLQLSLKESENRLKQLNGKLSDLKADADRAKVPEELRKE